MDTWPPELVVLISAYLEPHALLYFALTSRGMHALVFDPASLRAWLNAQPMKRKLIHAAKELLFSPEVTRTEVLRFVHDSRRAVDLVNRACTYVGLSGVRYSLAYRGESLHDGARNLLWMACSLNNTYLARALCRGTCLCLVASDTLDIYFDLLFRHGLWEDACKDLPRPLSGRFWVTYLVPTEMRERLFTNDLPEPGLSIVGFRRVYKHLSLRTFCPYTPAAERAAFLAKHSDGPLHARAVLRLYGYGHAFGYSFICSDLFSSVMAFMREGRWRDDVSALLTLACSG